MTIIEPAAAALTALEIDEHDVMHFPANTKNNSSRGSLPSTARRQASSMMRRGTSA